MCLTRTPARAQAHGTIQNVSNRPGRLSGLLPGSHLRNLETEKRADWLFWRQGRKTAAPAAWDGAEGFPICQSKG